jgi:hypothetical protein
LGMLRKIQLEKNYRIQLRKEVNERVEEARKIQEQKLEEWEESEEKKEEKVDAEMEARIENPGNFYPDSRASGDYYEETYEDYVSQARSSWE